MIKHPLSERFHKKVFDGIKISTIRPNPWPIGKPIQLFHWADKPYASKHVNGPVVIVCVVKPVEVRKCRTGFMHYIDLSQRLPRYLSSNLYIYEGFDTQEDMDTWFCRLVKPGETIQQYQMLFRLNGDQLNL
jgi:hypothetical protein